MLHWIPIKNNKDSNGMLTSSISSCIESLIYHNKDYNGMLTSSSIACCVVFLIESNKDYVGLLFLHMYFESIDLEEQSLVGLALVMQHH
jgi:hypothetical protein